MKIKDALQLGRVSNLPTVWTNVITAILLSGSQIVDSRTLLLLLAFSLFYTAGMFLNDYYDAAIDQQQRPTRPIPSGRVLRTTVLAFAIALLVLGFIAIVVAGAIAGFTAQASLAAITLVALIWYYNYDHKQNHFSPLIMGLCRVLIYIGTSVCFIGTVSLVIFIAAICQLSYLIGLTYSAKQENLNTITHLWPLLFLFAPVFYGLFYLSTSFVLLVIWLILSTWILYNLILIVSKKHQSIKTAVGFLIAGIAIVDTLLIAIHADEHYTVISALAFILTLYLQKFIKAS